MSSWSLPVGGYAPRATSHGVGLEVFQRVLTEGSNGMVEVPVTWNILDRGRAATDLFALVESGELFMCYFSTSYQGARVPALNIIELPYLFPDLDAAHAALDGELGRFLSAEVAAGTGFELLGFWDNGFRHFSNRLRPVRSPEDCAGLSVRLQPNRYHEAMIRGWGAVPVAVELSEGVRMITAGEVDAQENPLANLVAYGVDRVHPYVTMTAHLYGARGLFAHRPTLGALPADLRQLVGEAAGAAIACQREAAARGEGELRQRLAGQGAQFVDLTHEEQERFRLASEPAWELAREELPARALEWAETMAAATGRKGA